MKQMFQGGEGGDPEAALDSFMKELQTQIASEFQGTEAPRSESVNSSGKSDKSASKQANPPPSAETPSDNDVDRTISKLLNDMANADIDEEGNMPGGEEAMFRDMMKEFEKMGGGMGDAFDQDAVVDGMMQQLLSKEIMYEPMKQVTERFPSWLEENKEKLSEEEFKK
jgi:peroxin-19